MNHSGSESNTARPQVPGPKRERPLVSLAAKTGSNYRLVLVVFLPALACIPSIGPGTGETLRKGARPSTIVQAAEAPGGRFRGVVLAALVQVVVNCLLQWPRWEGEKGEVRPQCGSLKAPHRRLHPLPLEAEAPEAALLTRECPGSLSTRPAGFSA